ncbi:MAG: hypothetical protein U0869_00245 [Chloroflexota bacterium]
MRRAPVLSALALAVLVPGLAACGSSSATPPPATPTPAASAKPVAAASPGVTVSGTTVTIVGQGRFTSPAFTLPKGTATMAITACKSNGVMPFITLADSTGTSAGLIVDAQKELKNLAGGDYTVSAQANPDCVWQVVITPAA